MSIALRSPSRVDAATSTSHARCASAHFSRRVQSSSTARAATSLVGSVSNAYSNVENAPRVSPSPTRMRASSMSSCALRRTESVCSARRSRQKVAYIVSRSRTASFWSCSHATGLRGSISTARSKCTRAHAGSHPSGASISPTAMWMRAFCFGSSERSARRAR